VEAVLQGPPTVMTTLLTWLTILAYGASFGFYLASFYARRALVARAATGLLGLGIVFQYFALLERSRAIHAVPYQDLYGSMSLFGWLLAVTYLSLELYHRQRSVGAFVLPFVLVVFLAAHLSPATPSSGPMPRGTVFALHVTLSILAYAAFALSFVLSLMFLAQERLLRGHKMGGAFWRLPPLELLERMSRSSVLIGLISISAGTIFGFVWVDRLKGSAGGGDIKHIVTLLVFGMYAAYLFLSRTAAWRGARASILCVLSFVLVVLSFTVVNVYLSHYHRYF
jgi:ABC-type transport system involved in cytochrome c biogenesis permease subunit